DEGGRRGGGAVVAGRGLADLRWARVPPTREEILRGEQHARRAEATLERVLEREGLLQVAGFARGRYSLDGIHAASVALHGEHEAAAHDRSVHAHRARTAHAVLAAHVRARQLELVAEEVHQALARLDPTTDRRAVDGERDGDGVFHVTPARARRGSARGARPPGVAG